MSEPFFGLGQPMWTGLPSPGFNWLQPGPSPITRGGLTPFATAPLPNGAVIQNMIPLAAPGSYPGLSGADLLPSPTAVALLSAVALRRGQPMGPTNDQEIEEFIYDGLDLLAGANDVEVRSEGGRITFTGSVHHKRLKRDIGEIGWAIPGVNDVQNNLAITTRRRARVAGREPEPPNQPPRKQA